MPDDDAPKPAAPRPAEAALFDRLARSDAERHFFRRLDHRHAAVHARCGRDTLIVAFERVESVLGDGNDEAAPLGQEMGEAFGWSYLSVLALGQTWFSAEAVYAFFDELIDEGFFDEFERVLFFGAGTCAQAACSFSVAAPGATVLAFSPQATLDPGFAGFDERFRRARRLDFTSRYGYAPDMLDAAEAVHLFFDPAITEDAAHAAQFNRPHVRHYRLRNFGENPARVLASTGSLAKLLALFDGTDPDAVAVAQVLRDRRENRSYLLRLLDDLGRRDRAYLAALVCNNVAERLGAPRFRNRRDALVRELNARGVRLPFQAAETGGPDDGGAEISA